MTSHLVADILYALRAMTKRPAFTVVVVLTLAVGIGANTAMFATLSAALLRQLPYPEPERLVLGRTTFDGDVNWTTSGYDYYDYRELSRSFESLAATTGFSYRHTITGAGEPDRAEGASATWDLFATLGASPVRGRSFAPDEGPDGSKVVVLSHSYYQERFGGSPEGVGETLVVDGTPCTVVGVLPAGFHYLYDVDVWSPLYRDGPFAGARRWHNLTLVGRLQPGVTLEVAQSEVDVISRQLEADYPGTNEGKALLLTPLHESLVENAATGLALLMAAVTLVLLIACGNVAGLLLGRGFARQSEMAVRASLGASRVRLVAQLLTESVLLALASGALGVALAAAFQQLLLRLLPMGQLGITEIDLEPAVLLFAVVLSLVTALAFGTVPALRGTSFDLTEQLKPGMRTTVGHGRGRLRSGLVVAQVAISLVLLAGAGLLIRSFARQLAVDLGFDPSSLLTAEVGLPADEYPEGEQRLAFFASFLDETRALPGVESAALANRLPIRDPWGNIYLYPADKPPLDPQAGPSAYMRIVTPGYFETLGIPLLAGRDLAAGDRDGTAKVLVVSEATAEVVFEGEAPLGRHVIVDMGEPVRFEVVGVVGNAKLSRIDDQRDLAMYAAVAQFPMPRMRLAARTSVEPASLIGPLRDLLRQKNRNIPLAEPATMESIVADSLADSRVTTGALSLLAAVALTLSAVGLYGVLAYDVSQRHAEIGLRMALGARRSDLLGWMLGRGFLLVGLGWALGLAGALASGRLVERLLFETEAVDSLSLVLVSVFLAAVALQACLIPAWRAVRVDPARALYSE